MVVPKAFITKIPPERRSKYGLPLWSPDYLPLQGQLLILKHQRLKPWHKCQYCKAFGARLCCKKCAHVTCHDKHRYCNRACQKADWARHREDCPEFIKANDVLVEGRTLEEAKCLRVAIRQSTRWTRTIKESRLVDWLVRQAYRATPYPDPERLCLHINMEYADRTHPRSPVIPTSFQWRTFAPRHNDRLKPEEPVEQFTHFNLIMNGISVNRDCVDLKLGDYDDYLPGWPYIFAQATVMGDISPVICKIRYQCISVTLQAFPQISALLPQYVPPIHLPDESTWKPAINPLDNVTVMAAEAIVVEREDIDRWMEYMYAVTSQLRSRFHSPCEFASKHYGHLT